VSGGLWVSTYEGRRPVVRWSFGVGDEEVVGVLANGNNAGIAASDSVAVRSGLLFVWGWVFKLVVRYANG
jgi:hypothetical protein